MTLPLPRRWRRLLAAWLRSRRELVLFALALLALGSAGGVFQSTFNNYLHDTFQLTAAQRSGLEFPRELPGFLCAALAGGLAFLPEARLGAAAVGAVGIGMLGLAWSGSTYASMVFFMFLWSMGDHLFMPVRSSIGMQLAEDERSRATRLGQLGGLETAATMIGCLFVWVAVDTLHLPYAFIFAAAGTATLVGVLPLLKMRLHDGQGRRPARAPLRRQYGLYYLLCILFGARKQVFITFGPWVLVKVFTQPPSTFARLGLLAAILSLLFKPALGRWIDRLGERRVLMADAGIFLLVCLGYGCAEALLSGFWALGLIFACYLADQILFATGMARATYLRKIAVRDEEVTSTLSLGVSLDHTVSMSIPSLGGWAWMRFGYPWVFVGAALLSALNLLACHSIKVPQAEGESSRRKSIAHDSGGHPRR